MQQITQFNKIYLMTEVIYYGEIGCLFNDIINGTVTPRADGNHASALYKFLICIDPFDTLIIALDSSSAP